MTDLYDLVEPLKRELAVPGEFATTFPNTSPDDLADSLMDGFSEAQLQGFFQTLTLAETETSEDLSAAGGALVILFTGMRILRAQLRATLVSEKYSAKPGTEFEIQRSAALLRDELAYMNSRLSALITEAKNARTVTLAVVIDAYEARTARQLQVGRIGGFFDYEWK